MASVEERFWAKVDKGGPVPEYRPDLGPCWIWTRGKARGYGQFRVNGKSRGAHCVAYELLVGAIPEGLELDHLCRVPSCVNPAHLEPVTRGENVRRGLAPAMSGARMLAKTHCPQGHPYDEANTYVHVVGKRLCRECRRRRVREYQARRRMEAPNYRPCHNGHPEERRYVRPSTGQRVCRDCRAAAMRRWRAKTKAGTSCVSQIEE